MSILSLPAWFDVLECELQLVPEVRAFQGPFGGPTEVQDLIGDRWRLRATMPDGDFSWGGRTGALFNRLRGGANWLRMHDFARPVPRGTARGFMVLASSAAQGASQLTLSGLSGENAVRGGSFEVDTNGDGVADQWTRYSLGTTGTLTDSLYTIATEHGNNRQSMGASALGTTADDRHGVQQAGILVQHLAGQQVTLACSVSATAGTGLSLSVQWFDAAAAYISGAIANASATGGTQTMSTTTTVPSNAVTATVTFYQRNGTGVLAQMHIDVMRLVAGAAAGTYPGAPTLLAGDKLGHGGEQLLEVAEDATATDAGLITVQLTGRLRKAIASGQVIAWDRPQVPFQLVDNRGVPTAYTRGRARGQQVEFVEAWQA